MFTSIAGVFRLHLRVGRWQRSDSSKDQGILTWLTQTFLMVWNPPAVAYWSQQMLEIVLNYQNCP